MSSFLSTPSQLLKTKSIWKSNGDKCVKYIQFKIYVINIDILSANSECINELYMITLRRHGKNFSTTAMPVIRRDSSSYYVLFDQSFLLPSTMYCLNDTVRAKYAVLTIQHKDKDWTNNTNFIFDAEVYLPLHDFYLDSNKTVMMPKDISYPFTVGNTTFRLNLHIDMKEIGADIANRSSRSLGRSDSLRGLTELGMRSRSNSIGSDTSFQSNSTFASYIASTTNGTPAPSPSRLSYGLDKRNGNSNGSSTNSISNSGNNSTRRLLNETMDRKNGRNNSNNNNNDSNNSNTIHDDNEGDNFLFEHKESSSPSLSSFPENRDPKLRKLIENFPSMDSIKTDRSQTAESEEDNELEKEKQKIEEIVRLFMMNKESSRSIAGGVKQSISNNNNNHRRYLDLDANHSLITEEGSEGDNFTLDMIYSEKEDSNSTPKSPTTYFIPKTSMVWLIVASLCYIVLLVTTNKFHPVLQRNFYFGLYVNNQKVKIPPMDKEKEENIFPNNVKFEKRKDFPKESTALIDEGSNRQLPRFLRVITRFLQRINPFHFVGSFVKMIHSKGLIPHTNKK